MLARIGALLILGSTVFWLLIPVVPFLDLTTGRAAATVAGLVVAREVVFWIGVLFLGRQTWVVARRHGWRRTPAVLWGLIRRPSADPVDSR